MVLLYLLYTYPKRTYSLIVFTNYIDPDMRTDRVVAKVWDATFNLFDGIPSDNDIKRLADNTPKQEAGRFSPNELVLARANKSLRLFEHVVNSLSEGRQPGYGSFDFCRLFNAHNGSLWKWKIWLCR